MHTSLDRDNTHATSVHDIDTRNVTAVHDTWIARGTRSHPRELVAHQTKHPLYPEPRIQGSHRLAPSYYVVVASMVLQKPATARHNHLLLPVSRTFRPAALLILESAAKQREPPNPDSQAWVR